MVAMRKRRAKEVEGELVADTPRLGNGRLTVWPRWHGFAMDAVYIPDLLCNRRVPFYHGVKETKDVQKG